MTTATDTPKPSLLDQIKGRAREVLKAMSEAADSAAKPKEDEAKGEESKAEATDAKQVPVTPPDPDEIPPDTRASGASPKESDLDDAGEQASAGAAASEPPPGADGAGDADGDDGGAAVGAGDSGSDDGERPVSKAFDAHGNHDLSEEEKRELLKAHAGAVAFGNGTGQEEPGDLLKGGSDIEKLLIQLLEGLDDLTAKQSVAIDELRAEVNRLTAGHSAQTRTLSKALKDLEALGQPKPKAITKAFGAVPDAPRAASDLPSSDKFYLDLRSGKLSPHEAMERVRASKGGGY